ncbi:mitosis inhibitor protein kinase swe1 [Pleosporales sp. CAS-2024a]
MDFGFSPHREGGTLHLPSPTHPHSYRLEGTHFSHLQQLRRSLSRSPSKPSTKPSRFQLRNADAPRSPLSPLGLARAFSPKAHKPASPAAIITTTTAASYPESPLAAQPAPATKRFSLRRAQQPFRSSPRTRTSKSKSPRRPLGDSPDVGNAPTPPVMARPTHGQENTPRRPSVESPESMDTDQRPVNDKPIKFAFAQSRPDLSPAPPAKSSPLKRNDGLMNLNESNGTSPNAKRRSLHGGASGLGNDFASIFDQTPATRVDPEESSRAHNDNCAFNFASPVTSTPLRRTTSLRRSTLSQRVSNTPRAKPAYDGEFALPGAAASKTRNRMSLDSSLGQSTTPAQTPFRTPTFDASRMGLPQQSRGSFGSAQPHPLSMAHTPSSSASSSSTHADTPMAPPRSSVFAMPQAAPGAPSQHFSRSLPLGIGRPQGPGEGDAFTESFDTPFKAEVGPPVAFSTGLLSKKNRNVDEPAAGASIYVMPDTPSKRQSFPPAAADRTQNLDTPLVKRKSLFGESARPQHLFGTPSTPFSANVSKFSVENLGKRSDIFGKTDGSLQRRGSFISIDDDDDALPDSQSPTTNRMMDSSQSSVDDMPPTPTKPSGGSSRRSKESSLRRKTFRSRPSIGADTFAAPEDDSRPTSKSTHCPSTCSLHDDATSSIGGGAEPSSATVDHPTTHVLSFPRSRFLRQSKRLGRPSPLPRPTPHATTSKTNNAKTSAAAGASFGAPSPQTPSETFANLDASRLSLSGRRRDNRPFAQSLSALAPATPTTPRENYFFNSVQGVIPIGLTKNDVDESLSGRFHEVKQLDGGEGEFSVVYRVSKPVKTSPGKSPAGSQVWVVKKSKKPYLGVGDRSRKMREVDVLYALRGNDHVLDIKTHWEADAHLYIQTEYCEGGNLRKYLDTVGFNSRLDDFRIWKILLELSMGLTFIHNSGYIHLDLKPANILIDFEGGLKIADFGLASSWPAPKHIDGEGDRHYLAPEALTGGFDKPADVFALGMMLAEIAGNCVIPENGVYWQKLRSGESDSVLPSLTWSADSSTLSRDAHGDPVPENSRASIDGFLMSDLDNDSLASIAVHPHVNNHDEELAHAPKFMIERYHEHSMDHVVKAMLHQDPAQRPTAEMVLCCFGCSWVESRRRAGATVYEGNFGPGDEVLDTYAGDAHHDVDADMMDMS